MSGRDELLQEIQQLEAENAELKAIIKEMITAIDDESNLCFICKEEFGKNACSECLCSECPWAQARDRGKEWTEES